MGCGANGGGYPLTVDFLRLDFLCEADKVGEAGFSSVQFNHYDIPTRFNNIARCTLVLLTSYECLKRHEGGNAEFLDIRKREDLP